MSGPDYAELNSLPPSLKVLEAEASCAGFSMMTRLRREWEDGVNQFKGYGEVLLGAFRDESLIGTAGLSRDPYLNDPRMGRLRHVYVLERDRGLGIARTLVLQILAHARGNFEAVRLSSARAAPFYDRLGFRRAEGDHVTHVMRLIPIRQP